MFWDKNTRFELVPHNEESRQVMENLDTEKALEHGVCRRGEP